MRARISTHTEVIVTAGRPSCFVSHQLQEKLPNIRCWPEHQSNQEHAPSAQRTMTAREHTIADKYRESRFFNARCTNPPGNFSGVISLCMSGAAAMMPASLTCPSSNRGTLSSLSTLLLFVTAQHCLVSQEQTVHSLSPRNICRFHDCIIRSLVS